jgi:hypothetical protein
MQIEQGKNQQTPGKRFPGNWLALRIESAINSLIGIPKHAMGRLLPEAEKGNTFLWIRWPV